MPYLNSLALTNLRETALIVGGANLLGFSLTALTSTHKLTDLVGVGAFVLATARLTAKHPFLALPGALTTRETLTKMLNNRVLLVNALVILWGSRLAGYLFYRVNKVGEDKRLRSFYREEGESWFDASKSNFPLSLGGFWSAQSLWGWFGTWGVTLLNSATPILTLSLSEYARGLAVSYALPTALATTLTWLPFAGMATGLIVEAVADAQKYAFKSDPSKANKWCDVGLWSLSRYPNYFGEMLFWWSTYFAAVPGLLAVAGACPVHRVVPLLMGALSPSFASFLLLKVSGIPIHERNLEKRHGDNPAYRQYVQNTNLLLPFPKFNKTNETAITTDKKEN